MEQRIENLQSNKQEQNQSQEQGEEGVISQQSNLQDCFQKFRRERVENMKHAQYLKQQKQKERRTQQFKDELRKKFIEQSKKYFGVPYHKRYLTPEDELYNSPLFLDCCGLIRQVIYDLREDFGFTLGRWNQSYQFDILPNSLKFEEMKPGDLVFISGTYFNEKLKPFPHRMTHVEIYTGGETGEQTIGARWQRGVVQYHDSYKFVSKSYHDMQYYFKSIDTWLEGVCKSFCEEHQWRDDRDLWVPDKYSVFAGATEDAEPEEYDQESGNTENQITNSNNGKQEKSQIRAVFVGKGNNDKLIRQYFEQKGQQYSILPQSQAFSKNFFFKWVQCLQELDFFSFKEGEQIINHIPNIMQIIGSKSALINTLQDFYKEEGHNLVISPSDFFPETYQLDNMAEEIAFLNSKSNGIWIIKPKNLNMGRGIQIVTDIQKFRAEFVESKKFYLGEFVTNYMIDHKKKEVTNQQEAQKEILKKRHGQQSQEQQENEAKYKNISTSSIIQKYIENPLLLKDKKFDIRCYGLISRTEPFLLLFHHGYLRFCICEYTAENIEDIANSKFSHLTNAAIQKKHPQYKEKKQDLIWSMDKFEEYLQKENGVSQNQIDDLNQKIKKICSYVMQASMKKLEKKIGQYELLGIDIILDSELNPYLLEVNSNPALFCDTEAQSHIIPEMMHSTMDIVIKINENAQNHKKDFSIDNYKELPLGQWEVLYDQSTNKGIISK